MIYLQMSMKIICQLLYSMYILLIKIWSLHYRNYLLCPSNSNYKYDWKIITYWRKIIGYVKLTGVLWEQYGPTPVSHAEWVYMTLNIWKSFSPTAGNEGHARKKDQAKQTIFYYPNDDDAINQLRTHNILTPVFEGGTFTPRNRRRRRRRRRRWEKWRR